MIAFLLIIVPDVDPTDHDRTWKWLRLMVNGEISSLDWRSIGGAEVIRWLNTADLEWCFFGRRGKHENPMAGGAEFLLVFRDESDAMTFIMRFPEWRVRETPLRPVDQSYLV